MNGNGLLAFIAALKIVALQHAGYSIMGSQADKVFSLKFIHPSGVKGHFGFLGIEYFKNLFFIGFGVFHYLLVGKGGASFRAPGRVANHAGKIAN